MLSMRSMCFQIIFLVSLSGLFAHARVFDFNDVHMAMLLRGSAGTIHVGQGAYGDSMGSSTTFDSQPDYGLSGEAGIVILDKSMNFVVSAEYLTPAAEQGIIGSRNGSGVLMNLDSAVYGVVGWLGVEVPFRRRPTSRILWGFYGGYAQVYLNNGVRLTDAGVALYPLALRNHEEHASGGAAAAKSIFGWEYLFSANVTMTVEMGYRYLIVNQLAYSASVETVSGSKGVGADVKNNNGESRPIDLSGSFIGINFRFYL